MLLSQTHCSTVSDFNQKIYKKESSSKMCSFITSLSLQFHRKHKKAWDSTSMFILDPHFNSSQLFCTYGTGVQSDFKTCLRSHSGSDQCFSGGSDSKESACSGGDLDLIPGFGRSPGEGNGYPLQYSCLENPVERSLAGCPWSHRVRHDFHFHDCGNSSW